MLALTRVSLIAGASLALVGCALTVPKPHEFYEDKSNDLDFTNVVLNNIKCELRRGYEKVKAAEGGKPNPRVDWLDAWGAKAELKFTTEELDAIAPGALFKPPPPFSLGVGASTTAHSTRIDDSAVTYAFSDLWAEAQNAAKRDGKSDVGVENCDNQNGILIQSDLDIDNFLYKYVSLATIPGTIVPDKQNTLYNTLSYSVTFVASYDANITPTWNFKHVTFDGSGKLLDASRTKTSNLIITFSAATQAKPDTPASLSAEGQMAHLAAAIGQAVATASQSITH